jgi:hypothetical protein
MPKRENLFADMQGDDRQAALLVSQVGGMPNELQLVLETAEYDAEADGLRPLHNYIVRILGVIEHRIVNLGTTVGRVELLDDHPLLYQYNQTPVALFVRGQVQDVNAVVLDVIQAHSEVFGFWRRFPEYMNVEKPLFTLFSEGGGLLGQMPKPLADKLVLVMEKHGLETKIVEGENPSDKNSNPMLQEQKVQCLFVGSSYFISYAFSIDELGKV